MSAATLETPAGIERDVQTVTEARAFEILVGDCLRLEPFPGEIQVTGTAYGWSERIKAMAKRRGLDIAITVTAAAPERSEP